ncbi:hypothetical protein halTADL_2377 [Halohasta litchfieldiae]|uniref:Uncharacterized protein n=1 Tax=Halohasta litchfieldiae TaxID=1073996 RepID=A0A1H6U811_9EURY|nr:hypothetical protein halTADL_2377 [Halohasta litchfieldiae]SEI86714.1 hypothetical protein SAMN05444271_1104 [Halohasta litchfieldiae]
MILDDESISPMVGHQNGRLCTAMAKFHMQDSHSKGTIVDDLAEHLESTWSLLTKYRIRA